jgi:mono/diheme cytochrome c family protein
MHRLLLSCTVVGLCCAPAIPAQTKNQLPDGAGKETTQKVCGGCHAPEIVMGKHLSKEGWAQLVSDMVNKGANGTDDEFNQIIDYLAAHFPEKPAAPQS